MKKMASVGDIFEIPLSGGKKAYGQYLHQSSRGPIIQIYGPIAEKEVMLDRIIAMKPLFPPVITGLQAAIKAGLWKVIGNKPIKDFVHPKFVSTLYDQETGEARIWFLWDGQKDIKIGELLPDEYKALEFLVVWNPTNIVRRIEDGEVPYPYGDLIKYNKFTPSTPKTSYK